MDQTSAKMTCAITCWGIAALTGALGAIMLMVLGDWTFFQAAFIGVVVFALLGLVLSIAICRPLTPLNEVRGVEAPSVTPAAAPVAKAAPSAATVSATATAAAAMDTVAAEAPAAEEIKAAPAAKPKAKKAAAPKAAPAAEDYDGDGVVEGKDEGTKPEALSAARGGKPDNLKEIKGIGPKLEKLCNSMGFYHFDQIANWTADEVAWVNANLEGFKGRVTRDEWVAQAKLLAAGGETEFSKRVGKGDVY